MAQKVLGDGGRSLADAYDVEGSIVGVDELDVRTIRGFHEMGSTMFSERLRATVRLISSGAIAASTNWDIILQGVEVTPSTRIAAVAVIVGTTARVSHCNVSLHNVGNGRDLPLFLWDTVVDGEVFWRAQIDGGAVANNLLLLPTVNIPAIPSMMVRARGVQSGITEIAFRGRTTAFGAGTVTSTALFSTYHLEDRGTVPSNEGLPIPSW